MDFITALDIGASGLNAERTHINVISMNLANTKTTRTVMGGPYRRKTVVVASTDVDEPFSKAMNSALNREIKGVRVLGIVQDRRPLRSVHEPAHPDANAEGYVMYPDINVVEEMANLMTAQRNYEANVAMIDTVKGLYTKALEIGR